MVMSYMLKVSVEGEINMHRAVLWAICHQVFVVGTVMLQSAFLWWQKFQISLDMMECIGRELEYLVPWKVELSSQIIRKVSGRGTQPLPGPFLPISVPCFDLLLYASLDLLYSPYLLASIFLPDSKKHGGRILHHLTVWVISENKPFTYIPENSVGWLGTCLVPASWFIKCARWSQGVFRSSLLPPVPHDHHRCSQKWTIERWD